MHILTGLACGIPEMGYALLLALLAGGSLLSSFDMTIRSLQMCFEYTHHRQMLSYSHMGHVSWDKREERYILL
jgi:hypothetical protein